MTSSSALFGECSMSSPWIRRTVRYLYSGSVHDTYALGISLNSPVSQISGRLVACPEEESFASNGVERGKPDRQVSHLDCHCITRRYYPWLGVSNNLRWICPIL